MTNKLVYGFVLADLHFGASPLLRFNQELDDGLFNEIKMREKPLDFIVIAGDLNDMKETVSSDVTKAIVTFLYRLIVETHEFNTQIVIIEGTRSHDSLQGSTYQHIIQTYMKCDRVTFISQARAAFLCGMKVLYLPEEYVLDQDAYYKEFFCQRYDMIFGHGMINQWYTKNISNDSSTTINRTAPIFDVDQLCKIGNYIYFGHIHDHLTYGENNRFHYVSSYTKWQFDQTGQCGFYEVCYDRTSQTAIETYHENTECPVIKTYRFQFRTESIDEINRRLDKCLDDNYDICDKLRFKIILYSSIKDFEAIQLHIRTKMKYYPKVKVVLDIIDLQEKEKEEQAIQEMESKPYLCNRGDPDENRIADFILQKQNQSVPLDIIREVCGID